MCGLYNFGLSQISHLCLHADLIIYIIYHKLKKLPFQECLDLLGPCNTPTGVTNQKIINFDKSTSDLGKSNTDIHFKYVLVQIVLLFVAPCDCLKAAIYVCIRQTGKQCIIHL